MLRQTGSVTPIAPFKCGRPSLNQLQYHKSPALASTMFPQPLWWEEAGTSHSSTSPRLHSSMKQFVSYSHPCSTLSKNGAPSGSSRKTGRAHIWLHSNHIKITSCFWSKMLLINTQAIQKNPFFHSISNHQSCPVFWKQFYLKHYLTSHQEEPSPQANLNILYH